MYAFFLHTHIRNENCVSCGSFVALKYFNKMEWNLNGKLISIFTAIMFKAAIVPYIYF